MRNIILCFLVLSWGLVYSQKELLGFEFGDSVDLVKKKLTGSQAKFYDTEKLISAEEFKVEDMEFTIDVNILEGKVATMEVQSREITDEHSAKELIFKWFRRCNSLLQKDLGLPENLNSLRLNEIPNAEFTAYRKWEKEGQVILLGILKMEDVWAVRILFGVIP